MSHTDMTHATPRPWAYQLDPAYTTHGGWKCEVKTELGEKIASVFASSKGEALKRAALIVQAVNERERVKEVLQAALACITDCRKHHWGFDAIDCAEETQLTALLADMEG